MCKYSSAIEWGKIASSPNVATSLWLTAAQPSETEYVVNVVSQLLLYQIPGYFLILTRELACLGSDKLCLGKRRHFRPIPVNFRQYPKQRNFRQYSINFQFTSHDLIPTSPLLQLEAGRNFETFIASTSGLKPFSSTDLLTSIFMKIVFHISDGINLK